MSLPYIYFILIINYDVLFGMRVKSFEGQFDRSFNDPFSLSNYLGAVTG